MRNKCGGSQPTNNAPGVRMTEVLTNSLKQWWPSLRRCCSVAMFHCLTFALSQMISKPIQLALLVIHRAFTFARKQCHQASALLSLERKGTMESTRTAPTTGSRNERRKAKDCSHLAL